MTHEQILATIRKSAITHHSPRVTASWLTIPPHHHPLAQNRTQPLGNLDLVLKLSDLLLMLPHHAMQPRNLKPQLDMLAQEMFVLGAGDGVADGER